MYVAQVAFDPWLRRRKDSRRGCRSILGIVSREAAYSSGRGLPVYEGGEKGKGGEVEGVSGKKEARRRKAVAARSSWKDDGKCWAEQSSWRRLNKSHYKLASAGCTKLTNSLYIKTNRPSRFLPIRPGWSRNGYKLQKWLLSCSLRRLEDSRLGSRGT